MENNYFSPHMHQAISMLYANASYMHVCSISRTSNENPVSLARFRDMRQEVRPVVMPAKNVSC